MRADADWARNTTNIQAPAVDASRRCARAGGEDEDGDGFGAAQYTKARAVREHYQARLAKIEYEERVGNARLEGRGPGRGIQQVPAVPRRDAEHPRPLAAMVAAETDEAKCYEILDDGDPEGAE